MSSNCCLLPFFLLLIFLLAFTDILRHLSVEIFHYCWKSIDTHIERGKNTYDTPCLEFQLFIEYFFALCFFSIRYPELQTQSQASHRTSTLHCLDVWVSLLTIVHHCTHTHSLPLSLLFSHMWKPVGFLLCYQPQSLFFARFPTSIHSLPFLTVFFFSVVVWRPYLV